MKSINLSIIKWCQTNKKLILKLSKTGNKFQTNKDYHQSIREKKDVNTTMMIIIMIIIKSECNIYIYIWIKCNVI